MDPRDRADALLSKARTRGAFVVTPEDATSPMDASNTQKIPRSVVQNADYGKDPDRTTELSSATIEANDYLATPDSTMPIQPQPGTRRRATATQRAEQELTSEADTEELEGLLPTMKRRGHSDLSRRLDGF